MSHWGQTHDDFKPREAFKSQQHKLPTEFSKILTKKTWHTLNEQEIAKSTAGWKWIRHYLSSYMANCGVKVQDFVFLFGLGF